MLARAQQANAVQAGAANLRQVWWCPAGPRITASGWRGYVVCSAGYHGGYHAHLRNTATVGPYGSGNAPLRAAKLAACQLANAAAACRNVWALGTTPALYCAQRGNYHGWPMLLHGLGAYQATLAAAAQHARAWAGQAPYRARRLLATRARRVQLALVGRAAGQCRPVLGNHPHGAGMAPPAVVAALYRARLLLAGTLPSPAVWYWPAPGNGNVRTRRAALLATL
jgi:hypothetical protein